MDEHKKNSVHAKHHRELRQTSGPFMRNSWTAAMVELAISALIIALAVFRKIPVPTIPLLLLAWLSLWLREASWQGIGLFLPERWKPLILLAILIGCLYQLFSIFILIPFVQMFAGTPLDLSQFEPLRNNLPLYLTGLILTWTLAAFGEEMVFRGYLLNRVADLYRSDNLRWMFGLLFTSMAFGMAHISQGITGIIDNIVMGGLLGILYLASYRSLWLPILVHGIVDTIGLTLIFLGYFASSA